MARSKHAGDSRWPATLDALVLDADYRQALAAVRSLGSAGRAVGIAATRSTLPAVAFSSRWPSLRAVLPEFSTETDAFVDAVLRLVDRFSVRVLIPSSDGSIAALTPHRARIEAAGAVLALAADEPLGIAADKRLTLQAAEALGVPVPKGHMVREASDIAEAARRVGLPAVIKPALSWAEGSDNLGRMLCSLATTPAELDRETRFLLDAGAGPIVQQYLPGRRESVQLLYSQGRIWSKVGVTAHRTAPPLGGNSVLRETIPLPPDTDEYAERLVRELDVEGYSEVEFRRDAEGRPVLMEINARLSGSVEVAMRAGVDFPTMLFDWAAGLPLQPVDGYREGVRLRWMGGDLRWLRDAVLLKGQVDVPPLTEAISTFSGEFLRPTAYDFFDRRDPRPALAAATGFAGTAVRYVQRRRGGGASER